MYDKELIDSLFTIDYNTGTVIVKKRLKYSKRKVGDIANSKHSSGYEVINIQGTKIMAHRLIYFMYYGELPAYPEYEVDHINHNRSDNRISNLRLVTKESNQKNASLRSDNKSSEVGITWNTRDSLYTIQCTSNGRTLYLGCSKSLELAKEIRDKAYYVLGFHESHGKIKE